MVIKMCIDCYIKQYRPHEAELMNIKEHRRAEECPVCGEYGFLISGVDEDTLGVYRDYFMKKFADESKCVNLSFETLQKFCKRHTITYSVKEKGFIYDCYYVDLDTMEFHEHKCNKENCPYVNGYK